MKGRKLILSVLLVAPLAAFAEQGGPAGGVPAAVDACADKDVGVSCSYLAPSGTVKGTCRNPRGDRTLCVPRSKPGTTTGNGGEGKGTGSKPGEG